MNIAIFLDDVLPINGALMIIPKSHKQGVLAAGHDVTTTSYPLWTLDKDTVTRLAQEAALLAERSDISEELDRLRSHLQQFSKLLDGAGEMGKKLDFLLQEMHREANTLLSKTPGVESEALAITGLALEIKAEIEKLREQVQNIE